MKTPIQKLIVFAILVAAPLANASVYTGSWTNKTFGSTGALTIDFTKTKSKVAGSFDFDGPVFGAGDPPAISFTAPLKSDGSGSFKVVGTAVGDLAGSFTAKGKLTLKITNIPGGFLSEARINGNFDLVIEKFAATYEIDAPGGLYANGVAQAHVPKAPVIKAVAKVNVTGKTGEVTVKVFTNTGIQSVKATASGNAKVSVKGKNPYQVKVSNLSDATTKVKITVTNADGLSKTKTVKFVKRNPAPAVLNRLLE